MRPLLDLPHWKCGSIRPTSFHTHTRDGSRGIGKGRPSHTASDLLGGFHGFHEACMPAWLPFGNPLEGL